MNGRSKLKGLSSGQNHRARRSPNSRIPESISLIFFTIDAHSFSSCQSILSAPSVPHVSENEFILWKSCHPKLMNMANKRTSRDVPIEMILNKIGDHNTLFGKGLESSDFGPTFGSDS